MIPQSKSREGVFLSSGTEQSSFGMDITAEAFKIFSSQVYQHKIAAVVREYSCNACDSHIQAGTDAPFDIKLPTQLDPTFRVEDYGLGLDDDGVRTIFSTYFKSTKRQSEQATGFLGIGSKSAYSYADSFLIEATKDGVRRTYNAFFDESQIPALVELSEVKVNEPNGVAVSFHVEERDFHRFEADVAFISSFLKITPNVINGYVWNSEISEKLNQKGWTLCSASLPSNVSSLYSIGYDSIGIVMGGVVYPITNYEANSILEELGHNETQSFIRNLRSRLFIEAPMGSVEFAASRETLSMTPETRNMVGELLVDTVDKIYQYLKEEIDVHPHVVPAARAVDDMLGFVPSDVKWKNSPLRMAKRSMRAFIERMGFSIFQRAGHVIRTGMVNTSLESLYDNVTIFEKDTSKTGGVKWAKEYAKTNSIHDVCIVAKDRHSHRNLERIKKILGVSDDKVISLSNVIPSGNKKSGSRVSNTQVRGTWIDYDVSYGANRVNEVMETDGYKTAFVERHRRYECSTILTSEQGRESIINLDFHSGIRFVRSLGIDRIIFINKQNENKIKKIGIPSLQEVIDAKIEENRDEIENLRKVMYAKQGLGSEERKLYEFLAELKSESIEGVMTQEEIDLINSQEDVNPDCLARSLMGLSKERDETLEISKRFREISEDIRHITETRYPLLRAISSPRLMVGHVDMTGNMHYTMEAEYVLAMDLYHEAKLIEQI